MEAFYVTVLRGRATGCLLGPYDTREEAEANVDRANRAARELDPWCGFDAFGVTRVVPRPGRVLPAGYLNQRIGLVANAEMSTA
ncbi:hypothetical protein [Frankia sp. R43]|uniref:hypothetical protein n=1 Tax=Frankia sp. R43 TaxID=269536 RepID=UPI0006CA4610|nr:hypothetical protein [Frankia sp. R43]